MRFRENVENMVTAMRTVAKESNVISISFSSIGGVEIHVSNSVFVSVEGQGCEVEAFSSWDYSFRVKQSFGGATWFTLVKGEKIKPFADGCLTLEERYCAVGAFLASLKVKESTASVGPEAANVQ